MPASVAPVKGHGRNPALRLAWENPLPVVRAAEEVTPTLALLPPPPPRAPAPPRPRLNLAVAIEAHLSGRDGLTEEDFLVLFARGSR